MTDMLSPAKCVEIARDVLTETDWRVIVANAIEAAKGEGADAKNARDFLAKFCLPEKIDEMMGGERAKVFRFEKATEADYAAAQAEMARKEAEAKAISNG